MDQRIVGPNGAGGGSRLAWLRTRAECAVLGLHVRHSMGRLRSLILAAVCLLATAAPSSPVDGQLQAKDAGKAATQAAGARVYVTNERAGTVTVIDTATDKVTAIVRVGGRPRGLDVSRDGGSLYVALSHFPRERGDADAVVAIDTRDGRVKARHLAGADPEGLAVTPDGRRLYVSNEEAGTVTALDLRTNKVLATVAVGTEPEGVTISPDGRWVYVTSETSSTLAIIDAHTGRLVSNLMTGVRPRAVAFSAVAPHAYVTAEIGRSVSMVDTATRTLTRTLDITAPGSTPVGVAVSLDGRHVLVANGRANSG